MYSLQTEKSLYRSFIVLTIIIYRNIPLVVPWNDEKKDKQWWSTILPISSKQTTISHLKSLNTKRPRHVALEIQCLAMVGHKNVARLNQ